MKRVEYIAAERLNIKVNEVLRLLGYKDLAFVTEKTRDNIKKQIEEYKGSLKPGAVYDIFEIKGKGEEYILLENNLRFQGQYFAEKFKNCHHIIVVLSTVGNVIDSLVKDAFNIGNVVRGITIDSIGTAAVGALDTLIRSKLIVDVKAMGCGITAPVSPGNPGFVLEEQAKVFQAVDGEEIGITLTESNFIIPSKSTTALYGVGKGIGICTDEHICSECTMTNCSFRV